MAIGRKNVNIAYIANAGVMLFNNDRKVLIDGIHSTLVRPYLNVDTTVLNKIRDGEEPYDKIDLLMFTHHHAEHFDPYWVCEILKTNRLTQVICTKTIVTLLQKSQNFDPVIMSQLHQFDLSEGSAIQIKVKEIIIEVIRLKHDGDKYDDVDNFAYIVHIDGKTFLHLGDSAPDINNFRNTALMDRDIDVLIAAFPYIGLNAGRKVVKAINPRRIIVMHLPNKELDSGNWIFNTHRVYNKYERELPPVDFFENKGEEITIK